MVVKVYISGISASKEVKKRQQRAMLILDSKNIKYEVIDISEPGSEDLKDFMHNSSTALGATISDPTPRHALPPQLFNDDVYCGDYDQFDMANEIDEMEKFLKLAPDDSAPTVTSSAELKLGNGDVAPKSETETVVDQTNEADAVPADETNEEQSEQTLESNETDDQKIENGNQEENADQKNEDGAGGDKEDDTSEKADES